MIKLFVSWSLKAPILRCKCAIFFDTKANSIESIYRKFRFPMVHQVISDQCKKNS